MKNIKICRSTGDEAKQYQGYIEPEDGRWRLFVDHEGFPHLLIAVKAEGDNPGDPLIDGMLNIESMLDGDLTIKSLMTSTFGGDEPDKGGAGFPTASLDFGPGPHDFAK